MGGNPFLGSSRQTTSIPIATTATASGAVHGSTVAAKTATGVAEMLSEEQKRADSLLAVLDALGESKLGEIPNIGILEIFGKEDAASLQGTQKQVASVVNALCAGTASATTHFSQTFVDLTQTIVRVIDNIQHAGNLDELKAALSRDFTSGEEADFSQLLSQLWAQHANSGRHRVAEDATPLNVQGAPPAKPKGIHADMQGSAASSSHTVSGLASSLAVLPTEFVAFIVQQCWGMTRFAVQESDSQKGVFAASSALAQSELKSDQHASRDSLQRTDHLLAALSDLRVAWNEAQAQSRVLPSTYVMARMIALSIFLGLSKLVPSAAIASTHAVDQSKALSEVETDPRAASSWENRKGEFVDAHSRNVSALAQQLSAQSDAIKALSAEEPAAAPPPLGDYQAVPADNGATPAAPAGLGSVNGSVVGSSVAVSTAPTAILALLSMFGIDLPGSVSREATAIQHSSAVAIKAVTEQLQRFTEELQQLDLLASAQVDDLKADAPPARLSANVRSLLQQFSASTGALVRGISELEAGKDKAVLRGGDQHSAASTGLSVLASSLPALLPVILSDLMGSVSREVQLYSQLWAQQPLGQADKVSAMGVPDSHESGARADGLLGAAVSGNFAEASRIATAQAAIAPLLHASTQAASTGGLAATLNSALGIMSIIGDLLEQTRLASASQFPSMELQDDEKDHQLEEDVKQFNRSVSGSSGTQSVAEASQDLSLEQHVKSIVDKLVLMQRMSSKHGLPQDGRSNLTARVLLSLIKDGSSALSTGLVASVALLALESGIALESSARSTGLVATKVADALQAGSVGPDRIESLHSNLSFICNAMRILTERNTKNKSSQSTLHSSVSATELSMLRSLTVLLIRGAALRRALAAVTEKQAGEDSVVKSLQAIPEFEQAILAELKEHGEIPGLAEALAPQLSAVARTGVSIVGSGHSLFTAPLARTTGVAAGALFDIKEEESQEAQISQGQEGEHRSLTQVCNALLRYSNEVQAFIAILQNLLVMKLAPLIQVILLIQHFQVIAALQQQP
jgi:hypothetical protein